MMHFRQRRRSFFSLSLPLCVRKRGIHKYAMRGIFLPFYPIFWRETDAGSTLEKTEKHHHPADKRELFKEVSEGHTTLLQGFCRGFFCCQKRNSVSHICIFNKKNFYLFSSVVFTIDHHRCRGVKISRDSVRAFVVVQVGQI